MESLDIIIPEEMLWLGKTESLSPAGHRSFISSLASSSASSCSTSPLPLGDAAAAGLNQLWSIDEVLSLSCFDDFAEDSGSTTTATLEQQYHEAKLQNAPKYKVEEVLKEEPGEWQGLLPVTSGAVADTECFTSSFFPDPSSVYSLNSIPVNNNNSNIIPLTTTGTTNPKIIDSDISSNYVADTECLAECFFDEIKTFCSDFAAANYQHLTPPQTPPPSAPVLMQQQQVQQSSNMFANNQYHHQEAAMGLPNICLGADAPSMTSSIASPVGLLSSPSSSSLYGQRSNVDLQLQSNDLMDKSFVIAQDEVEQQLDNLDSIEKYIGFKDVLENYVLINTQASGTAVPDASSLLAAPVTPQQVAMSLSGGGGSSTGFAAPRSVQMADDSVDYSDDNATQYSTPSYGHSLASSPSRSGSPLDDMEDMTQDDADWSPASMEVTTSTKKRSSSSGSPFKRRPYERGGGELEKKTRKKEQNKNAATRYRQKKKQEVETILEEETRLRKTNKKLTAQFNEGRREMKYLKNLLREMYKQNGILI